MNDHFLTALPVYNEVTFVNAVLDKVKHYSQHVLVIDDGSDDGTSALLAARDDIQLVTHSQNRGYGAALISAFQYAMSHDYNIPAAKRTLSREAVIFGLLSMVTCPP